MPESVCLTSHEVSLACDCNGCRQTWNRDGNIAFGLVPSYGSSLWTGMHGCRDTGIEELIAIAQALQLKHQKMRAQNCFQARTRLSSCRRDPLILSSCAQEAAGRVRPYISKHHCVPNGHKLSPHLKTHSQDLCHLQPPTSPPGSAAARTHPLCGSRGSPGPTPFPLEMWGLCVSTPLPAACEPQVRAQGDVVTLQSCGSVPAAPLRALSQVTHGTQLPGSFLQTEVAKLQGTLSSMATSFPLLSPLSLNLCLLLLNFVFRLFPLCLRNLSLMPWLL